MCDNYLGHLHRVFFFLFDYTPVCSPEFYTVKWLKQQGVMFEARRWHVDIVPKDYVGTMCYRVIIVV